MLLPGAIGTLRPFVAVTAYTPPLDGLSAYFAYSVARRLSGTYTGALIRVRRASDNTESDIGYVSATNEINKTAISSFCGASNGYVVVVYDQSGNGRDLRQPTAANQPQVYNGSSVLTMGTNSRVYALLDGTNDSWTHQDSGDPPGVPVWSLPNYGIYAVAASAAPTSAMPLFCVRSHSTASNVNLIMELEATTRKLKNRIVAVSGSALSTVSGTLVSATANTAFLGYVDFLAPASLQPNMDASVDAEAAGSVNVTGTPKTGYPATLGADLQALTYWQGRFQELFGFTSRQGTHTDIKDNVNGFYALY